MRRATATLFSVVALLVLAAPGSAGAQVASSLERLEIVLWPEYDRPDTLVMLRGWLPPEMPLTAYVPLPIPVGLTPTAVAKRDPGGTLLLAAHTILDRRSHQEVRVVTDSREIRVEYYAPLTHSGSDRSYAFSWPGGLSVGNVRYEIQQPVGATVLSMTPPVQQEATGFDGLTYYSADLGSKAANATFEIRFNYSKASTELTRSALQAAAAIADEDPYQLSNRPEPPRGGYDNYFEESGTRRFPWLIILPLVLLAALLVVWFRLSGADS